VVLVLLDLRVTILQGSVRIVVLQAVENAGPVVLQVIFVKMENASVAPTALEKLAGATDVQALAVLANRGTSARTGIVYVYLIVQGKRAGRTVVAVLAVLVNRGTSVQTEIVYAFLIVQGNCVDLTGAGEVVLVHRDLVA